MVYLGLLISFSYEETDAGDFGEWIASHINS